MVEVLPIDIEKPFDPENLQTIVAVINGKVNVETKFDTKSVKDLKEIKFTNKDKKLFIKKIDPKYLDESKKILKIFKEDTLIKKKEKIDKKSPEVIEKKKIEEKQKKEKFKRKFLKSLNPQGLDPDGDGDGMLNALEITFGFNPRDPSDAALDADGDGLTNLQEILNNLNPNNAADAALDADSDGMTNIQEILNNLNPNNDADAALDADDDDLPNILEFNNGTSPIVANPDVDKDNISNEYEVENTAKGMNPYVVSKFSDKVDDNYYANNVPADVNDDKYINFTDAIKSVLGDAATIGDGISDIDELLNQANIKSLYNITDPKLDLDPTHYNLHRIIERIQEYRTIVNNVNNLGVAAWEDFDHHWYDEKGQQLAVDDPRFNPAHENYNTLYDPKNWTLFLIVNISKTLQLLDGSDGLGGSFNNFDLNGVLIQAGVVNAAPLSSLLMNSNADIGGLLFRMYKIMDPDGDYIKNSDEEFATNTWAAAPALDTLVENKIEDYVDIITQANPIYIELNPDFSVTSPFTGQLLLNAANASYPHALLRSNLEFNDAAGAPVLCPGNTPMLRYPVPGQSGKFIFICPRNAETQPPTP